MHNVSINTRRRESREPRTADFESGGVDPPTRPLQEDRLMLGALRTALDALPTDQREVILLVGLEEFSYAETAAILGVPIGTVMSRLHRGRERLREMLAQQSGVTLRRIK